MLDAICNIDQTNLKTYSIFEFKALPESEIDRLRYSLLCPVCKQKAYFRKASVDGKQACFGSRYHESDCAEFNPSLRKSEEEKQVAELEKIVSEEGALQIDFSFPTFKKAGVSQSNKTAAVSNNGAVNPEVASDVLKVNKQGLKKLLVSLLRGSSLASADIWIYTSEKHKWRAKNLFVNVNDAKPTDNGSPRLYWGTISHADESINWLNPAEERSVTIPIGKYRDSFVQCFDINDAAELEGAGFIMFAKCVESKDKKRKYLQLWGNDLQYCYISKAEE